MLNRVGRKITVVSGALALLLLVTACGTVGEARTLNRSVEQGTARRVAVSLEMGAGSLKLTRGGERLLDLDVETNVDGWEPQILYSAAGEQGELALCQPADSDPGFGLRRPRYNWDVRLGEQVVMDLDVQLGAGRSDLVLAGLDLSALNVETGAGESTIDLRGDWSRSFDASVSTGAGKVVIILPATTGVSIDSSMGLGMLDVDGLTRRDGVWVNDVYGTSDVTLNLIVAAGAGKIELRVAE
jgi:hypothetical protein